MPKSMKFLVLLMAASIVLGATDAYAARGFGTGGIRGGSMGMGSRGMSRGNNGPMAACREDLKKLCGDKAGEDRRACISENVGKLSNRCKEELAAQRQKQQNAAPANTQ